ncbi:MAG TPA: UDP-N-acetylmuramate--L-alanine ligase [Myxococcota bacterium]|nr:UDP-N-acetylmuramate--L-alanine ligase [Myxococcota bacterium]
MDRRIQQIHFVGIGGIGMCGLAELLHNQGYRVTGSDLKAGPTVDRLCELGVRVSIGHAAENVGDAHVVVYSSAVRATNPELREAEARAIPAIPRAEMLAEVMRLKNGIAIAGSHGKTTTTSFIAHVLDAVGLDPTAIIGGRVFAPERAPTGARLGAGDWLVAEADESDGSFLRLSPVIAVVTNIDPEHLDHYGSYEALQQAFAAFANRVPFWGLSVLCFDHPGVQAILPRMKRRKLSYGFAPQADIVASAVEIDGAGMRFSVRERGAELGRVRIRLPGRHNVLNALATLAVSRELDVPFGAAAAAIEGFLGVERRFELKGEVAGIRVYDDYAHHPAEIRATLAAARGLHTGRIVVAFQPHRYTRTRDLWEQFVTAFNDADFVLIAPVYAAGEDKLPGVESAPLVEAMRAHGHRHAHFVADLDALVDRLAPELRQGDLVFTLGAGNISTIGSQLVERLLEDRA